MKIGVPKEIKPQENRIGLTPESVKILTSNGHEVLVENNGGFEAGFYNDQYKNAGAKIIDKAEDIFSDASKDNNTENVVKIKDRKKAIVFASQKISHNDCLVILGKGHEETQEEQDKISFFSDHEVINEIYK